MPRTLPACLAVVLVTLLVASVAQAQYGRFRRGPQPSIYTLATNEAVQKEVGITRDKVEQLRNISRAFQRASQAIADVRLGQATQRALSPEARQEYRAKQAEIVSKLRGEYESKLAAVIGVEQIARLKEIRVQAVGLDNPQVAEELGLGEDQRAQLREITRQTYREIRRLRADGLRGELLREKSRQKSQAQNEASLKVLTDEQNVRYATIRGKPFDVSQLRRRRR